MSAERIPDWVLEGDDRCPVCHRPVDECIADLRAEFRTYGQAIQARVVRSER